MPGVLYDHPISLSHRFDNGALLTRELGQLASYAASGEIRNNSIANTGNAVIERTVLEQLERPKEHSRSGNHDFGAPGSDAGDFAPRSKTTRRQLRIKLPNLSNSRAEPVGVFSLRARNLIHYRDNGRRRRRSCNCAVELLRPVLFVKRKQLLVDVAVHAMQFVRTGRIRFQKHFSKPYRAKRLRNGIDQLSALANDQLRATAANIDDQRAFFRTRPSCLHAQMYQSRFFRSGNNFDIRVQRFARALQKFLLIAGIANRAGCDRAYAANLQRAVNPVHVRELGAQKIQRIVADAAGTENALAESCDLPLLGQNARLAVPGVCRHHPH